MTRDYGAERVEVLAAQRHYGQLLMEVRRPRRPLRQRVLDAVLRWPPVTAVVFVGGVIGIDALGRWLFG